MTKVRFLPRSWLQIRHHRAVPVRPPRLPQEHAYNSIASPQIMPSETPRIVCLHDSGLNRTRQPPEQARYYRSSAHVPVIFGSPGWGYRGLRPVLAIRQVTPAVGIATGRVLRRWYRAKGLTKQITVQRIERATGRIRCRRCRKRKQLLTHNRGFVIVNDGPAVASQLARYLNGFAGTSSRRPHRGGPARHYDGTPPLARSAGCRSIRPPSESKTSPLSDQHPADRSPPRFVLDLRCDGEKIRPIRVRGYNRPQSSYRRHARGVHCSATVELPLRYADIELPP